MGHGATETRRRTDGCLHGEGVSSERRITFRPFLPSLLLRVGLPPRRRASPWCDQSLPARLTRKAALRVLARDAVILLCLLGIAEVCLQALAPRYAQHRFDAEYTGRHPINMNAQGFRGPVIAPARDADEARILALGDSVTFGTAVAWEETWAAQLAAAVADEHGAPTSVINAALPAMDLRQMRVMFDEQWADYSPDVVALAVTGNTVSLGWIRRHEPVELPHNGFLEAGEPPSRFGRVKADAKRMARRLALPSFLSFNSQRALYHLGLLRHTVDPEAPYGVLLAHGWRQADLSPAAAEEAWDLFAADLVALRDAIEAAGARLIVTYSPPRFTLSDSLFDNEKAMPRHRMTIDAPARAADLCERLDIDFVDVREPLRAFRANGGGDAGPLYLQFDYTHFSPAGHRVIAEAMARRITILDRVPVLSTAAGH